MGAAAEFQAALAAHRRRRRLAVLTSAFVGALAGALVAAGMRVAHLRQPTASVGPSAPVHVGLWVRQETVLDPDGARAAVELARRMGVRALYVQVLTRGEAAYRSGIWPVPSRPRAPADPLGELLGLARAAGMKVHAWLAVYSWGRLDAPPAYPNHPLVRHPEWVTVDRSGRSLWRYRVGEHPEVNALFVDPAIAGVQRTVVETVLELARRYDLDGIQLDYVRYPGPDLGFHPMALRRFWQERASGTQMAPVRSDGQGVQSVEVPTVPEDVRAWQAFREAQVREVVRQAAAVLEREGMGLELSAAVMPDPLRARREYSQDWLGWLREGLVGSVALMSYTTRPSELAGWVRAAVEGAGGRPVYAGIAVYRLDEARAGELVELVQAARQAGASGVLFFSFEALEGRPTLQEAIRRAVAALAAGDRGGVLRAETYGELTGAALAGGSRR